LTIQSKEANVNLCVLSLLLFLCFWFLLSILNQLGRFRLLRPLRRIDLFQLLPMWNFFAPNPGVHDFYLLYRDKTLAGEIGNWLIVQPTQHRGSLSCLWNPGKVERKVLSDAIQMFAGHISPSLKESPGLMLTVPYLVCLQIVVDAPRQGPDTLRQFVLAQKKGLASSDEILPILISDFHSM
jgi:hypothetical protein